MDHFRSYMEHLDGPKIDHLKWESLYPVVFHLCFMNFVDFPPRSHLECPRGLTMKYLVHIIPHSASSHTPLCSSSGLDLLIPSTRTAMAQPTSSASTISPSLRFLLGLALQFYQAVTCQVKVSGGQLSQLCLHNWIVLFAFLNLPISSHWLPEVLNRSPHALYKCLDTMQWTSK